MYKEVFNIVVAFDSNYRMLAETMLVSLMKNNHLNMNIYLLYSHLKEEEIDEVKRLIDKYYFKSKKYPIEVNLIPIYIDKENYKQFFTTSEFPIEACYRLIMQDILPQDLDRALWLDSDLIIRGSIYDFYKQPFLGNYAIACEDMPHFDKPVNPNLIRLGMNKDDVYFNSGVMVLNLEKIRKEISVDRYFEVMKQYKDKLKYPDQDTINIVFKDKIKQNWSLNFNLYFSAKHKFTDKYDVRKIKKNASIYHYISSENKPTNYKFNNFGFDEYWKYGKYSYGYKKYIIMKIKNKIYRFMGNFKH